MGRRSPYGKRGGEGKNTGKVASVYEVTLPDGTTVKKRSFDVHESNPTGWGVAPDDKYPQWIVSIGSRPSTPAWVTLIELSAKRIKEGHP